MVSTAKWTSVTRGNFSSVLPQVLLDIKEADFVAFDTELTGLHLSRAHRNNHLDDLITRYGKLRECVFNFGLLQVGLACFKWNASMQKYKISAFSFYVFPSAANGIQQERKFSCQLGSLAFLSEYKFDFNKSFHEGIPFITRKEEMIIKSNSVFYSPENNNNNGSKLQQNQKPIILLKDDEKLIVSEVFEKIDAWLEVEEAKREPESESLELPPMNSFQRLIFYQQIPLKYGENLSITKKPSGSLSVKKVPLDPESRATIFQEERVQFEKALEEQIGFRRVIDCIVDNRKPIVGHNCWVDLLHFQQKFVDNNLPSTLSGFKEEMNKNFPLIIDTKFLARLVNIKETSLGELTEMSSKYPEYVYFSNETCEESTNLFHDAGFDAICTGRVFLNLLSNFLRPKEHSQVSLDKSLEILFKNDSLCNRLNILQSDYSHLDLKGCEFEPDRSNVLYIYGIIGGNTTVSDLQNALKLLVKAQNKINSQVHWLSEGSACFVQFEQIEMVNEIISAFKKFESSPENFDDQDINNDKTDSDNIDSKNKIDSVNSAFSNKKLMNLLEKLKICTYSQYQEIRDKSLKDEEANSRKRQRN